MAKPTVYNERVARRILDRVAAGETVSAICREPGMPKRDAVAQWIHRDYRGFGARFFEAFATRCALLAPELIEIVDEADSSSMPAVQHAKNRYEARRWLLGKLFPDRFGDKIQHHLSGGAKVELYLPDKRRDLVLDGQAHEVGMLEGPSDQDDSA